MVHGKKGAHSGFDLPAIARVPMEIKPTLKYTHTLKTWKTLNA